MELSYKDTINRIKNKMGKDLAIVGHHYQDETVIRHADLRGDSLELARRVAAEITAKNIVFCGVYFMAESAALLAKPGQLVYLPEPSANCSMAQMSPDYLVDIILSKLSLSGRKIIPLAYVNSSLAVKAVVGKYDGAVCTSANAKTMLDWAFKQGDAVLFLPDRNLAANTANLLEIPYSNWHRLSVRNKGENLELDKANNAKLLIWPGVCSIHARFTTAQVAMRREEFPGALVVVHPESSPEVVAASDAAGSTSYIIKYVEDAPDGSTVVIGTEINLVQRLAKIHKKRVNVVPLYKSKCGHMAKTTEERLATTLLEIENNSHRALITIPEELKINAKLALERMLMACS